MTRHRSRTHARSAIAAPPLTLALLEAGRSLGELAGLAMAAPMLMAAPRGDGHAVLVLPGFSADDRSTALMRCYIDYLGYRSSGWSLGRNFGYRTLGRSEELLRERVRAIASRSGQKISVIGWSLGGVVARHMARDHPDLIRQVITLAAPFTGDPGATRVRRHYELASGERLDSPEAKRAWRANRAPPAVPTTSVYSKTDGVTAWQNCLEVETPTAENIEIFGSHMGLPHNPLALYVIADRLAQPQSGWRPFAESAAGTLFRA